MKLIEALKKIEELTKKAEDIRCKIGDHSAHLNIETPVYENQANQVDSWLKMHQDVLNEILRLRFCIQRTNLATMVDVDLGDMTVTKSIAEWIWRRRELARIEAKAWKQLTDKGLKEGVVQTSQGTTAREIKVVRCYNPEVRDKMIDILTSEPSRIDARLESTNAVTDLIEN